MTVQGYTVTVQQYIWMHHLQNQSKSATTIATQKPVLPICLDQTDHNWPSNAAIWDVTFCPHVTYWSVCSGDNRGQDGHVSG